MKTYKIDGVTFVQDELTVEQQELFAAVLAACGLGGLFSVKGDFDGDKLLRGLGDGGQLSWFLAIVMYQGQEFRVAEVGKNQAILRRAKGSLVAEVFDVFLSCNAGWFGGLQRVFQGTAAPATAPTKTTKTN